MVSLALFLLGAATFFDLRTGKVPNQLIVAGYLIGGIVRIHSIQDAIGCAGTAVLTIAILYPLFLIKGLGAGDIKLFSALSVYCPPVFLAEVMVGSLFVGAGIAVWRLLLQKIKRRDLETHYLHYTVCILAAFVMELLRVNLM